jgi:adhesin/invasin
MSVPTHSSCSSVALGRRFLSSVVVLAGLLGAATSCGDHTATGPTVSGTAVASLTASAGMAQGDTVGRRLAKPLTVLALSDAGAPVSGVEVGFTVTAGAGTLDHARVTTTSDGTARVFWTLGTVAGKQAVTALVTGGTASVVFQATAESGAPATLVKVGGDQTGPTNALLVKPLQVRAADLYNNPVSKVRVFWIVDAGAGAADPETLTDSLGVATTHWRTGDTKGFLHVSARAAGLPDVVLNGSIVSPSDLVADSVTLVAGDNQTATAHASPLAPYTVRVTSRDGYPVQNVPVTWSVRSGGGRVLPQSVLTNSDGMATTVVEFGTTAGLQRVVATVAGLTDSIVFHGTALSSPAAELIRVSGDNQTGVVMGALADTLVAQVRDVYGNPIAGYAVTWSVTAGGGVLSRTSSLTDIAGRAATAWTLGRTAGYQTVEAKAGTLTGSPTVFTALGTPAVGTGAFKIVVVSGDQQRSTVSSPLASPLVVKVTDQYDNPLPGVTVAWACTTCQPGAQVAGTTGTTDLAGTASATMTLGAAGSNTVTATVGTSTSAVATFTEVAVSATLAIWSGDQQTGPVSVALPAPYVVRVTDAQGTPVAGARVTFTVTQGNGTVGTTSTTSALTGVNGTAQTTHTLRSTMGPDVVTAAVSGGGSVQFTANPTGPGGETRLVAVSGNNQTGAANTALATPFVVRVIGATGTPVANVMVHWRLTSSTGQISNPDSVKSDVNGLASTTATLPQAPIGTTISVTASIAALSTPVTFTATVGRSADPARLQKVGGDGQGGAAGSTLVDPLQVLVTDASGAVLPGVVVDWSFAAAQGGGVSASTSVTDAQGVAHVSRTLGTTLGAYTTTASLPGFASVPTVTFTSTATTSNSSATVEIFSGDSLTSMVGTNTVDTLRVIVLDANRNPVQGAAVTWAVAQGSARLAADGSGSVGTSTTSRSDGVGRAVVLVRTGNTEGASQITATVPGSTAATFFYRTSGVPNAIVMDASTDGQTMPVSTLDTKYTTPLPLRVTVRDAQGYAVRGANVLFSASSSGGTGVNGGLWDVDAAGAPKSGAGAQPTLSQTTDRAGHALAYRAAALSAGTAPTVVSVPTIPSVSTVHFTTFVK